MNAEPLRIYHNASCSKSRSTCAILAEKGIPTEVVEYLKTPPTREELRHLLSLLGMKASELIRRNEAIYREHYADRDLSEDEWLDAMVAHPILIERPIVVRGQRAVLARPPERVLELF